jgi:nucleoside-diphosphate-sugar epimerase
MDSPLAQALTGAQVLVLGGSGVIGSRLVEVLVAGCGARVSVLVRNLAKAVRVARHPVELIHGDVADAELLAQAMAGKDIVIDCTFPKEGDFKERCDGARNMARTIGEVALAQGVSRLVHLSTISVYGRPGGAVLDETAPRQPGTDAYGASKLAGEQEMLRLHREGGVPVVILQPTIVYGPFTGWSAGPIGQLKSGTFVLPDDGRGACNAVYLDDVVQAILRAAVAEGVAGEVMLVSGDPVPSWRAFYGAYESMLGFTSTASMTEAEIRDALAARAKAARPARRLLRRLREDAALRQMVLGLPVAAQALAAFKSLTPQARIEGIKDRMLDRRPGAARAPGKPLLFPSLVQLGVYAPQTKVSIDKARRLLGYAPGFDLERGMALTQAWAQWARII